MNFITAFVDFFHMITNFKFRITIIIFCTKVDICVRPYINRLYLNDHTICIIVFIDYIILFIKIYNFECLSHLFLDFAG